ncbi:MAG: PAS domain-containing protein [Syntrophorhabdaceae bacterium]|nr:PAS domain-containing protein [Syntrophorhabdaceae bacterium]
MNECVLKWLEDSVSLGIFTTDEHLVIGSWNRWLEINTGRKATDVLGKNLYEIYPEIQGCFIANYYREALEGKTHVVSQRLHKYIIPIELKNNNAYFTHMQQSGIISALIKGEEITGTITIIEDVTERVKAEKRIAESEERYRRFIEASSDMIFLKDEDFRYVMANKAYLDFIKKEEKEIIGKTSFEVFPEDVAKRFASADKLALEKNSLIITEETSRGRIYEIRKFPVMLPNLKKGVGGFIRDVTDNRENIRALKESREGYHHLNLVLKAILNVKKLINQEKDVERLVGHACHILVETRGYGHALILLRDHYHIISSSSNVFKTEDMKSLEELVKHKTPDCIIRAFNDSEAVIVDPHSECPECPIGKEMIDHRCCNLKIEHEDRIYGILSVSLSKKFINSNEEKELLIGVAKDLGFAIYSIEQEKKRIEAEQQLKESYNRLRRIIGSVIDVISLAVESRDPYTAGHQKRVANLARYIAQEMGLSPEQIESVRMAGTIHDLGKIAIPAEILSTPRKLTPVEFELVKQHPGNGYEILKNIDYLKTVAEIVYQHHEKLDGSGYPRGLKGDEILIEARILSVADVVEAIASHRPYRPALGIDTALNEIEKNAGMLYDKDVVYACLKLFKEKGFKLE